MFSGYLKVIMPSLIGTFFLAHLIFYWLDGYHGTYYISKWFHWLGFSLLLSFLLVGQILLWFHNPANRITYTRLHRSIAEILPAPSAIMILLSGINLTILRSQNFASGYFFIMFSVFFFMFIDGILFYLPHVRKLEAAYKQNNLNFQPPDTLTSRATLVIHFVSLPLLVILGVLKPLKTWALSEYFHLIAQNVLLNAMVIIGWGGIIITVVWYIRK